MATATRNSDSDPDRESFLEELYQGRFRWDLIRDFPEQSRQDAEAGDAFIEEMTDLLHERVDPDAVDLDKSLPDGFLEEMAGRGYFKLQLDSGLGGHGLSHYNTFRVMEAAARWCVPVAMSLAIENTLGSAAFLPLVPEGPLHDLLRRHVLDNGLSASADTEPAGAANRGRTTTATAVPGADAYRINGEKVFAGHAPVAGLVGVTATVGDGADARIREFFLRTDSPGVTVGQLHEYMGVKGFPNGHLRLDDVVVPAGQMLVEPDTEHQVRMTATSSALVKRGRLHLIAAPSLAAARLCVRWIREFAVRRTVDGRPLGQYDEIRHQVAESLADTFAIETVTQWCLIPEDQGGKINLQFERNAIKSITSELGWALVDRTMSLMGAEGYETAESKARRGAPAVPVERLMRDVRNFRISGGVNFQIDNWIAQRYILSYYYPEPDATERAGTDPADPGTGAAALNDRNLAHLAAVAAAVHEFGRTCSGLARAHPVRSDLLEKERTLIQLTRLARELLTMSLVLARASAMTERGDDGGQDLADVYCTSARHRLADLRRRLSGAPSPAFAVLSDSWLAGPSPAPPVPDAPAAARNGSTEGTQS
ncbi:putative acyl-CoA dehydrogenase FadE10 [Streptomyces olivaceoviridis]|uniref:acyl-CoA dehydrogenase family protein n=1 Tax=Streptomyces olivaceoviridis TaxID=1921 RepID=UPI00167768FB|nr:acyl-CoA dehydrogenase family protein [Streptomyces olivaceoviridis]GGY99465.1 putative acyl-CoA dehydrogenase FadE10 [Streptomyces olivaceoviridis]